MVWVDILDRGVLRLFFDDPVFKPHGELCELEDGFWSDVDWHHGTDFISADVEHPLDNLCGNVAAPTQNQAMNALVFLYKCVLSHALQGSIDAVRAHRKIAVPVVMTREEVATVLSLMDGTAQLLAKLLYGSGLRIMEAVRLRIKDIDYQMKQLTVRAGKGDKDRFTTFPASLTPLL